MDNSNREAERAYEQLKKKRQANLRKRRKVLKDLVPNPTEVFPGLRRQGVGRVKQGQLNLARKQLMKFVMKHSATTSEAVRNIAAWNLGDADLVGHGMMADITDPSDPLAHCHTRRTRDFTDNVHVAAIAFAKYLYIFQGWTCPMIAEGYGTTTDTVRKWKARGKWGEARKAYLKKVQRFIEDDMSSYIMDDMEIQLETNALMIQNLMKALNSMIDLLQKEIDEGRATDETFERLMQLTLAVNQVTTPWADLFNLAAEMRGRAVPFSLERRARGAEDFLEAGQQRPES
jgi:hypothetical protein